MPLIQPASHDLRRLLHLAKVSDPSVVVSLGIGADVTAELQLKDKLPQGSEFFGADPVIVPNSELFSRIGIFFPFAVSKESGVVKSEIRENDG
ncbi:hypothetical protein NECAME_17054 [Necator americanus]|uniref:Uncharacterized protein n=1 Tax=Necator americanus TaxID=51031 RepID=W2TSL7_NECAM|nr:hypothetical protein NECAME_17054 [Necator americanus]ETN84659.1 hypothetical protein NECAME_17054 [Necator americanus]